MYCRAQLTSAAFISDLGIHDTVSIALALQELVRWAGDAHENSEVRCAHAHQNKNSTPK